LEVDVTVYDAAKYVQSSIVSDISGIRSAPEDPPDNASVYPFAVCFPEGGNFTGNDDAGKDFHDLVLQIHGTRKDLPRDYAAVIGYIEDVGHALRDDPTLGDNVETIVGEITYSFGVMQWGGVETLGPQFKFTVKIRP
jgi:hypothetical protein